MKQTVSSWIIGLVLFVPHAAVEAHDPYRVEYATPDGLTIIGDYWTPIDMSTKAPVVILLHMYRSDRQAWLPLVPALESAGFAILAIDLRGHGESVGRESAGLPQRVQNRDAKLFRAMYQDVFGAYEWLQQRPELDLSRVALVGASVGCSVALDYAVRDKSVDVAVLLTPGENYLGVDSVKHIRKYGARPVLMLTSEEERAKGTSTLAPLASAAEVAVFPETDIHGTRMFGQVAGVEERIAAYLQKHVGAPPENPVYASVKSKVYHASGSSTIQRINSENVRIFSSAGEAESRGLRRSKR